MSTVARPRPVPASPSLASAARALLATDAAAAPLVARTSLALLRFPHGAEHALGWFGGHGFAGTLGWMTDTLGFPAPAAVLSRSTAGSPAAARAAVRRAPVGRAPATGRRQHEENGSYGSFGAGGWPPREQRAEAPPRRPRG